MFRDDTFQNANYEGADQSVRMRRLFCAFVVRKPPKAGFHAPKPKFNSCECDVRICERVVPSSNGQILKLT